MDTHFEALASLLSIQEALNSHPNDKFEGGG